MLRWTSTSPRTAMRFTPAVYDRAMDTKLLSLLVCPVTKGPLEWSADKLELWSRSARLAYPAHDGIPILLENEARTLTDQELGL